MTNNTTPRRESTEKKVVGFLKKNADGLTITDLVGISKLSRSTIRVVLARLEGAEKVSFREIGMAKVYHLEGRK